MNAVSKRTSLAREPAGGEPLDKRQRRDDVEADLFLLRGLADTQHASSVEVKTLLARIASYDKGRLAVFAESDAIAGIIAALGAHAGVADVQKSGLLLLVLLASSDGGPAAVLAAEGALAAAIGALVAHAGDAFVQKCGLGLLANLASSDGGPAAVLAAEGALAAAIGALVAHAGDADVREWGLVLLRLLARSGGGEDLIAVGAVEVLFSEGEVVEPALVAKLKESAKRSRPMLLASMRQHVQPYARRSALALLYLGTDDDVRADFAAGSVGRRQLQLALASDEACVRRSGARAVAHLLNKQLFHFRQPAAGVGGAGAASGPAATMHHFADAFNRVEDSDVCFEIEGRTLHAHRLILRQSLATDVFAAMLRHDTADARTGRVSVEGVSFDAFALLIEYIYTGKVDVPPALLIDVFRSALRWMVGSLAATCAEQLAAQLAVRSWEGVWELVDLAVECQNDSGDWEASLQGAAARYMLQHVEELVEQPRFVERRAEMAHLPFQGLA